MNPAAVRLPVRVIGAEFLLGISLFGALVAFAPQFLALDDRIARATVTFAISRDMQQRVTEPGLLQALFLVSRTEAAANSAGACRQSKIVIEEDAIDADCPDLPKEAAVLFGGRRVKRGARVAGTVRPNAMSGRFRSSVW